MSTNKEFNLRTQNIDEKKSDEKTDVKSDDINTASKPLNNGIVMSQKEYAEKFRWWWYQQQCLHQMNIASYQFLYHLHLLATYNYFNQLRSIQPPFTQSNTATPASSSVSAPRQEIRGRECSIPPLWRRLVAEFIDFCLLFMLKLGITFFILDNTEILSPLDGDFDLLFNINFTPENAYKLLPQMLILEFVNRIFISFFEALSLRQGAGGWIGGSTPGKSFMGLRVVYCERVMSVVGGAGGAVTPGRVLVVPASDLMFTRALVRSLFKNFSFIILPIFLTSFVFEHNRSLYDILSSSVVVYVGEEFANNFVI